MPSAVIGALRVDLDLGTAGWSRGLKTAANDANTAKGQFQKVGGDITKIGAVMSAGITAPLVGIGVKVVKLAGDFEAAMIKVGISTQATGGQMKRMSDLALQLGKDTVFSASEAASAMDSLAKNGVSVEDILNGAATAAVNLAAATGSELDPAANAISDSMQQFKLSAKDLPMVINQITGAVNESKLDFVDFQQAAAQAGGVAGAVGVSFKDFNAVLAGTSSLFSSGSDAGTSFKTFLTTLNPKSKAAAAAMKEYGLSFFDASGKMRPMAEIADNLRDKLGKLDDKTKLDVMQTIFGTDAMRTAIGLMKLGGDGLDNIAAKIAKTDAAAQSAQRMKGFNAQLEQLGGSLETLAIVIGKTGLLTSVTSIVKAIADFVDVLAQVSPGTAQMVVAGAAIAAAIGPIMLVLGPLVSSVGTLIGLFGSWGTALSVAAGAAGGFLPLLAPLLPIIVGIGAAVGVAYVAWQNWGTLGPMLGEWASGVAQRAGEAIKWLEGIFDWINKLNASEGITGPFVQKTAAENAKAEFASMGKSSDEFLARLKTEFTTTWDSIDKKLRDTQKWADDFDAAAVRMWKSFVDMHARAQAAFNSMVDGISSAVRGKFADTMQWVQDKAKAVGDAFYTLYDRVVGHSYVPDLVDGIETQMRRLDGAMVDPADKATKKVADKFKQLRDDLKPLMDELFPEIRQGIDQSNKLDLIERARKAGPKNGGLSGDQADEARNRVITGPGGLKSGIEGWGDVELVPDHIDAVGKATGDLVAKLPDLSKASKDTTAAMVESFAGMAKDVLGSLRGMVSAFKGGDILGGLSGLLDIVQQVSGIIGGNKTPRATVNTVPTYGGGRALGGPVVPGKRYRVGEKGPEWLEVDQPGRIVPSGASASAGGGNVYHISGNLLTPEFWDQIKAGHDDAAMRGANGGAQLAAERMQARQRRSLYG